MPLWRIEETVPCLVTWRCEIEAANEAEARDKFMNGDRGQKGESEAFIGDSIDDYSLSSDMLDVTKIAD